MSQNKKKNQLQWIYTTNKLHKQICHAPLKNKPAPLLPQNAKKTNETNRIQIDIEIDIAHKVNEYVAIIISIHIYLFDLLS